MNHNVVDESQSMTHDRSQFFELLSQLFTFLSQPRGPIALYCRRMQNQAIGGHNMNTKAKKAILRTQYVVLALTLAVGMCGLPALGFQSSPEHELLFEKARYTMDTQGDLKRAVELFQQIIDKYPAQRTYAAKSHFYIGLCYEKLGYAEAVKAYELVLEKYTDQPEQVAAARARLAGLRAQKPGGLSLTKIEGPEGRYLEPQALSPDGTQMAGVVFNEGQNIVVFDLVTKRLNQLTQLDWTSVSYYAIWSPDGKKVAYLQWKMPMSILASTMDGKTETLFTTRGGMPVPFDWLPDGRSLLITLKEKGEYNLGLVSVADNSFKPLYALLGEFHNEEHEAFADASPDGRHIVFADGQSRNAQNIYCLSVNGGSPEVLAGHVANDIQPRWSPDGSHIVFLSFRSGTKALWGIPVKDGRAAGDPFIIQEMGQGTDLLNWTAQGLAYWNAVDMWDVFVVAMDPATGKPSGDLEPVDYSPSGRNRGLVWSPDGTHVAFFSADRSGQPGKGSIIVLPAQGGEPREYPAPMESFHMPNMIGLRWTADSSGVGFYGAGDKGPTLYRLSPASGEWKTWKLPTYGWTRIEWGKDGSTYFFTRNGMKAGIVERNLETGEERFVYEPEKRGALAFRGLRFSRDHTKLVASMTDMKANVDIVVVDLASGDARILAAEGMNTFAWSADGEKLLVLRQLSDSERELFSLSWREGTWDKVEYPEISDKMRLYVTDWSPDGKQAAFEMRRSIQETYMLNNFLPKK
jgi:Tol biopolymer transport system component